MERRNKTKDKIDSIHYPHIKIAAQVLSSCLDFAKGHAFSMAHLPSESLGRDVLYEQQRQSHSCKVYALGRPNLVLNQTSLDFGVIALIYPLNALVLCNLLTNLQITC